jgi:hypothetical protein
MEIADPASLPAEPEVDVVSEALWSGRHGWAFADRSTDASYSPAQKFNSSGGSVTATRSAAGTYTLTFNGLTFIGNPQVAAVGTNSVRCKNAAIGGSLSQAVISVRCFNSSGVLTDSKYTVVYVANDGSPGGPGGYGWFGSDCSIPEIPQFNWNSTGSYITCTRTGIGQYEVRLGSLGLSSHRGNLMITAQGGSANHCSGSDWRVDGSEMLIEVLCHTNGGSLSNTSFWFNYARQHAHSPAGGGAYATADDITDNLYTPIASESFTIGSTITAGKFSSDGRYFMRFPNFASGSRVPYVFGAIGHFCKLESWSVLPDNSTLEVRTRCFDPFDAYDAVNTVYAAHLPLSN